MQPYIISVNPLEDYKEISSSIIGIKKAFSHLKKGYPLGIFPAGEVSQIRKNRTEVIDREWQTSAVKMLMNAQVPVIPIYFHRRNSSFFYHLARLSGKLRTILLPSEAFRQKGNTLLVRIGNPIDYKQLSGIKGVKEVSNFLRKKTYILSKIYQKKLSIAIYKESFYKKSKKSQES